MREEESLNNSNGISHAGVNDWRHGVAKSGHKMKENETTSVAYRARQIISGIGNQAA